MGPVVRTLLLGLIGVFLAQADDVQFSLSTSGFFSSGTPADLAFAGIGTETPQGFGPTFDGSLALTDLGAFTLFKPTHGNGADVYRDAFTLDLFFFFPTGLGGQAPFLATFTGTLKGTVNTQQGSVFIDFGPAQTISYNNSVSSGSFDLTIDDLTLNIPHDGTPSKTAFLTGIVTNFSDPVTDTPEPRPTVLLGAALALAAYVARHRRSDKGRAT
jgi:hypothetical protein